MAVSKGRSRGSRRPDSAKTGTLGADRINCEEDTGVPTNEQRRATAKRKLERQIENRAERERKRRLYTIIGSAVAAVVVIAAVVFTVVVTNRDSGTETASNSTSTPTTSSPFDVPPPAEAGALPEFVAPEGLGSDCQYPAAEPASKPNRAPRSGEVPTEPALVSASMETDQGNIGLQLDNAKSPCTVNSFASLAQQGYFNDTPCHRLTTSDTLGVLQCGDPTGEGAGGPGYQFANEYPTDQYQPDDPALQSPVIYPRGTLAMANAGPGTNGSQFFLVYKDSQLPPNYTVFGTIDETGLATLDKIAAAGVADGGPDGPPKLATTVKSVLLD
jgi:peptidyl-prolyl cis-trans isomerase B (cyclophilin B)